MKYMGVVENAEQYLTGQKLRASKRPFRLSGGNHK